tara:strand:+ start:226 stop:603 length:378 start_codon:yes stop_codon:yes gene_type:complete
MSVLKIKNGDEWISVESRNSGFKNNGDVFAWASFKGSGELNKGYGVSSINRTSTGIFLVNLESPQKDMNFGTHVTPGNKAGGITNTVCGIAKYSLSDESSVMVFISYHNNNGTNADPSFVSCFRF